jgi:hypothetical protein
MSSFSSSLAEFSALHTNNNTTNPPSETTLFARYRGLLWLQSNLATSNIPAAARAQLGALYEEQLDNFRREHGQYVGQFDAEACSFRVQIYA